MSQPSRPRSRGTAQRRRREIKLDRPVPLEQRSLMAPVVATFPLTATLHGEPRHPTNSDLGNRHGLREHDGDRHRHDGADHVGLGADAGLVVRRRHRDDRGRARRRIRQRRLRDLTRAGRQRRRRRGQPARA